MATPVFAPDGTVRSVSDDQVQAALANGGKLAVRMKDPQGTLRYIPQDSVEAAKQAGGTLMDGGAAAPEQPKSWAESAWSAIKDSTSRYMSGAGDAAVGLVKTPIEVMKAGFTPPRTPGEWQMAGSGPIGLLTQRMIVQPAAQAFDKAKDSAQYVAADLKRGDAKNAVLNFAEGAGHLASAALPVVGPLAEHLGERAGSGDVAGALGEGTVYAVSPKVIGKAAGAAMEPLATLEKVKAPLAETMRTPRSAIPADSMTPSELKAYAGENGIAPLTAAQITEHNLPRHLQTAGERAGIGGTQIRQNVKAAQASIATHAEGLMEQLSPDTPTPADAGAALKTGIQDALERERQASAEKFAAIDDQAEGVVVDLRPLKQLATDLLNDSRFIRDNLKTADPKRMTHLLQDVTNIPDQGTFSQAQALRSTLFDESSHPDVAISSQAQAAIKRLTSATHEQMAAAAESKPGLMQTFENASAHWREMHDAFNNQRSPIAQALAELDPNKVAQKFTGKGQIGGSPFNAEILDQYGIDKGPIKRAILQDIYNKNFGLYGKTLAGYSHEFLQSVFTPEELQSVYKTGAIARSVGLNVNPPNTAETLDAIGGGSGAAKRVFLKTGKAALTKADWFNNWLMNEGKSAATPPTAGGVTPAPRNFVPSNWRDVPPQSAKATATAPVPAPTSTPQGAVNESLFSGTGASPAVSEPVRASAQTAPGTETKIRVPGEARSYQGQYQVRELGDVRASHSGLSFQANPDYALTNDRNYSNPVNQAKVFTNAQEGVFDPSYHITDNPDATNGPIVVDSEGHALGGNGRAMILERVYKHNPSGAAAYKQLLLDKAAQFGLDPAAIQNMKQPVLVREIADSEFEQPNSKQVAVTDFNKKGTAELTPAERAIADSRRVSQGTLDDIASSIEQHGPDATLTDVLRSNSGTQILDKLINEGIVSPQERGAYANLDGLTEAGRQRISKLMTARFFRDPGQIDSTPAAIQNKLERMAAPLAKVDGVNGWDIVPHVQEATSILEELRNHRLQNVDDLMTQQGLWGNTKYSPEAVTLAKALKSASATTLTKAARQYSLDAADAERPLLLGGGAPATPEQAFKDAFGDIRKRK